MLEFKISQGQNKFLNHRQNLNKKIKSKHSSWQTFSLSLSLLSQTQTCPIVSIENSSVYARYFLYVPSCLRIGYKVSHHATSFNTFTLLFFFAYLSFFSRSVEPSPFVFSNCSTFLLPSFTIAVSLQYCYIFCAIDEQRQRRLKVHDKHKIACILASTVLFNAFIIIALPGRT